MNIHPRALPCGKGKHGWDAVPNPRSPTSRPCNPGLAIETSMAPVNKLTKVNSIYLGVPGHLAQSLERREHSTCGTDEPQGTETARQAPSRRRVVRAAGKQGALVTPGEGTGRRPWGASEGRGGHVCNGATERPCQRFSDWPSPLHHVPEGTGRT